MSSTMTRVGRVVGLLVLSVVGSACRPKPTETADRPAPSASATTTQALADAGVAAADAAPAPAAERPFTLVAQAPDTVRFLPLANGKLLLASGPLLYEAKPDGTLALAASLEAFAAVLPDDESLVGYVEGSAYIPAFVASDAEGIVGQWSKGTFRITPDKLVAANGGRLQNVVTWKDRVVGTNDEGKLAWLSGSGPLPAFSGSVASLTTDASGGLVILGETRRDTTTQVAAPGAQPTSALVPTGKDTYCVPITALDHVATLRCRKWEDRTETIRFFRQQESAWKPAFVAATSNGAAAVGADGALWLGKGREIQRCSGDACKPVTQETFASTADVPSYAESREDVIVNNDQMKPYSNFHLAKSKRSQGDRVEQIVPRGAGDTWAIVAASGGVHLVIHTGTSAKSVTNLPGRADARVLVRNAKPPTPWVGHCEQIFVRTGPAEGAEALAKRAPELQKIVTASRTETDYGLGWAVVRGRLHDKESAGILLWRTDVESSLAYVERVANKTMDAFAKNPVDRPTAYCTMPVLDAVLAQPDPGY